MDSNVNGIILFIQISSESYQAYTFKIQLISPKAQTAPQKTVMVANCERELCFILKN